MDNTKAKVPPALNIPVSNNVVHVKAIDATTSILCQSEQILKPVITGHERLNLPTMCFLIENKQSRKRLLFDCGSRKDYWNLAPIVKKNFIALTPGLRIEKSVDETLVDAGIPLHSISSIVWSHWHWDHIGDASKFPSSVDIIVGPGIKEMCSPAWPTDPNSPLLETDTEGHNLLEITFDNKLKIGQFNAYDFFGDGSFYLLDVPGHTVGHICGLARTTATTFCLFGADSCHFTGMLRPSEYYPLPDTVPNSLLGTNYPISCACSMFIDLHQSRTTKEAAITTPLYTPSDDKISAYTSVEQATESLKGLSEFDASPDVLICIAHDPGLLDLFTTLNEDMAADINDWQEKGYKEASHWQFLKELPRHGKPAQKPIVEGLWKEGRLMSPHEIRNLHEGAASQIR